MRHKNNNCQKICCELFSYWTVEFLPLKIKLYHTFNVRVSVSLYYSRIHNFQRIKLNYYF